MTLASSNAWPESDIEQLLSGLAGVISARVVSNAHGRLDEIHILASDRLHPKQIVRNVESALCAGFGLTVDRRAISVAQTTAPDAIGSVPLGHFADKPSRAQEKPDLRFVYVGFDVRNATNRETVCHVTVRREREHYIGTGSGASTPQGRALAAAKGLISAIATARDRGDIALEDVAIVEAHGRSFVMVAAHVLMRRETIALTGVSQLVRSPEEAAILASLQAINRWLSDEF
ncbi:MAG TPA: hypothetical protein VF035_03615 [Longimicrobiales bacterium]